MSKKALVSTIELRYLGLVITGIITGCTQQIFSVGSDLTCDNGKTIINALCIQNKRIDCSSFKDQLLEIFNQAELLDPASCTNEFLSITQGLIDNPKEIFGFELRRTLKKAISILETHRLEFADVVYAEQLIKTAHTYLSCGDTCISPQPHYRSVGTKDSSDAPFVMRASKKSGSVTFDLPINNITVEAGSSGTISFSPGGTDKTIYFDQDATKASSPLFASLNLSNIASSSSGVLKLYNNEGSNESKGLVNYIGIQAPSTITNANGNYTLTLPAELPSASTNADTLKTLMSDKNGNLSWQDALLNGGNTLGCPLVMGVNDAQPLSLETAGKDRLLIDAVGNTIYSTSYAAHAYVSSDNYKIAGGVGTVAFQTASYDPQLSLDGNLATVHTGCTGDYRVPATGLYFVTAQASIQLREIGFKVITLQNKTYTAAGTDPITQPESWSNAITMPGSSSTIYVSSLRNNEDGFDTQMLNLTTVMYLTKNDKISVKYSGDADDVLLADSTNFSIHYMSFTPA